MMSGRVGDQINRLTCSDIFYVYSPCYNRLYFTLIFLCAYKSNIIGYRIVEFNKPTIKIIIKVIIII